ncbi:MAG TPA: type II secretion system F family protein [Gaiellaceae bacterium]|nr:type II secretion system F family protein [Gaiellaceae bacterium]
MTLVLVLGLLFLAGAMLLGLQAIVAPRAQRQASLQRVKAYAAHVDAVPARGDGARGASLAETLVPPLSRVALRFTPRVQREELQARLTASGLSKRMTPQQFLALKTVLASVLLVLALAAAGPTASGVLLALVLAAAGLVLPDFMLRRYAQSRADRITADLPEALDQIVVSLEAGVSFDAAVSFYVRRSRSLLARELQVMLSELRMGESRSEALRRLSERVPSNDMRNVVQTLLQSESVGMSRAALLANQAADLRHRRQMAAEESAHKAPIKMLFPLLIFILPVMFVVIFGPALQQMSRILGG